MYIPFCWRRPDVCICNMGKPGCLTDIDECQLQLDTCEEECVNQPGAYTCDCQEGLMLASDLRSCIGNRPVP